jgi:two-component system sensor histidine kinase RegB
LAEATAERLDGELSASNTGHGAQMRLRLPLPVIGDHA